MKLDFTGLSMDAQWHTHKFEDMECELEIEPYPREFRTFGITSDGNLLISGKEQKKIFMRSLKNARGLTDAADKEISLTEEIKEKIFDFQMLGIPNAVIVAATGFNLQKEAAETNL